MPSGVFRPYAGVSTAVVIFVRGGETRNVWFYDMQADGYSLDDKRDKIAESDIPDLIEKWRERSGADLKDRGSKAFVVPVSEIRDNGFDLSIGKYKEERRTVVKYDPPAEIIKKLIGIENEITNDLHALEGLIK